MALRGSKPDAVTKRLKAMFFGKAGVGKTTCALSFPRPYLIDTERGAENQQYVELLDKQGGALFQSNEFDELIAEVLELLKGKHEYRTLIIDPITNLYNDLLDKSERKVGSEFGRHYGEANKQMRHLMNLLVRLDMNVIVTCHAKNLYGDNLAVLGQTFDGWKKLDYLFDLVFEIQRRGHDRVGKVVKTRIEGFPEGDVFDWSFDEIARRYGDRDVLVGEAKPQALAGEAVAEKLSAAMDKCGVSDEALMKFLKKHESATLAELPKGVADKALKHYESLSKELKKSA